jgi:hypothetical protein
MSTCVYAMIFVDVALLPQTFPFPPRQLRKSLRIVNVCSPTFTMPVRHGRPFIQVYLRLMLPALS